MMISLEAYMMGRDKEFPPTAEMKSDANTLLNHVDSFLYDLGIDDLTDDDCSSGYRPGKYNVAAGGSPNSSHLKCVAIDLSKRVRELVLNKFPKWKEIGSEDRKKLEKLLDTHGLYMEHPDHTPSWMHLQTRITRNRIFIP